MPEGKANPDHLPVVLTLKALHIQNAAARVGEFSCSKDLFNKTDVLIDWAIRSNMSSVLTDCPHREKLGWLEEAHLVGPSIRYNYDIAGLCRKLVRDMMNAQTADGLVPDIAPEYAQSSAVASAIRRSGVATASLCPGTCTNGMAINSCWKKLTL